MDILKQVIAQKRKQVEDIVIDNNGSKVIRTADLFKKEKEYYLNRQKELDKKYQADKQSCNGSKFSDELVTPETNMEVARAEVIKRLRSRGAPILLFGETEKEALLRLRKIELEQPELKEGWKNDFQTALNDVDNELVDEVVKGNKNEAGKHDVLTPEADATWDQITQRAPLLGEGENPNRDCDIIREFLVYLLKRWGRELNAREEAVKRSPQGKLEAGTHKQTMECIRPLVTSLEKYTCNSDIRIHLIHICRLCIIERDYIRANNAYMQMSIGNAPWPVGVTRSGIHQRPGSSKAYVSNIAHVLNDETQRRYIHAVKRLMTKCQYYFPADPSKCVEFLIMKMDVDGAVDEYIPESYQEFMEKIECLRQAGNVEEANKTREEFSNQFPLLPSVWSEWIDFAIETGASQQEIDSLFERALKDFHSDDICAKYIAWSCGIDLDFAREKLERVVSVIGLRPDAAHIAWESYLDILEAQYAMLADLDDDDPRKSAAAAQLKNLFNRSLRIPHCRLLQIYERYLEFIGEGNEQAETKTNYEDASKNYKEIEVFENNLTTSGDPVSAFAGYIQYEIDGGNPARIQMIFERAVTQFPFSADLWLQYAGWADGSLKISQLILPIYDRACKLCCDYSPIWQQSLLALERSGAPYENFSELWENAKAAIQSEDESVSVYRTYIYLTHRYLVKTGSTDFSKVERLFKEAFKFVKEQFSGRSESTIQFRKCFAYYLYTKSKKPGEARSVWNDILSSGCGNTAAAWLEHVQMERHFGDLVHTRRLLYIAVNSVTDKPFDVFAALVQFEREEGTLEELDKAVEKVNAQAKRISDRQQAKDQVNSSIEKNKQKATKRPAEVKYEPAPRKKFTNEQGNGNEPVFKKPKDPMPSRAPRSTGTSNQQTIKTEISNTDEVNVAAAGSSAIKKLSIQSDEPMETQSSTGAETSYGFKYNAGLEKNKVFVRNVDFGCSEEELQEFFSKYGQVKSTRIVKFKSGAPKGVAYVEFDDEQSAKTALLANDEKIHGRKVKVFISNPPPKDDTKKPQTFDKKSTTVPRAKLTMVPRSISKVAVANNSQNGQEGTK
ncbi:prp18 domain-containing protein [Ditylenchus destructor]|uniref:Pre-mRNA-splicing factor 18 n=1 Tax=Ditylenchus destructor TaxID=166010 RepID=A0AAD4N7U8_9BILA|nr:prp18 domain-containing protein [Ditylenchus destructor]